MNTFVAVLVLAVCVTLLVWRHEIERRQEIIRARKKQGFLCWHGEPMLECKTCNASDECKRQFSRPERRRVEMHNRKFAKRVAKKSDKLKGLFR